MKKHGNSLENSELHHLYQINDDEENDVFKYGISGEPLLSDGSSARANKNSSHPKNSTYQFGRIESGLLNWLLTAYKKL